MAIACIVRDPARFNVRLPRQDGDDALQVVKVSTPQSLAQAAKQSGLSMDDLRDFNPAYRTEKGTVASSILLPKSAADQYKLGPVPGVTDVPDPVNSVADADDAPTKPEKKNGKASKSGAKAASAKDTRLAKNGKPVKGGKAAGATIIHKVDNGESLWTIARRHQVSVEELMKWNDLQTKAVKPGQVLRLTASK
jgi:membrane-bound lytic murein transglycosylase D